jgi:hypothetical protein
LSKGEHSPELHWLRKWSGWVGLSFFVSKQVADASLPASVVVTGGDVGGREGARASSLEHATTRAENPSAKRAFIMVLLAQ